MAIQTTGAKAAETKSALAASWLNTMVLMCPIRFAIFADAQSEIAAITCVPKKTTASDPISRPNFVLNQ